MKVLVKGYEKPWLEGQPNCRDDSDFIKIEIELNQASLLEFIAGAVEVMRQPHLGGFGLRIGDASLKVYREGSSLSGKGQIILAVKEDARASSKG